MSTCLPQLFSPVRLGSQQARNRVMRTATGTASARDGAASAQTVALHRRLARGGCGVIVSEAILVHPSSRARSETLTLHGRESATALARVADAVHGEGALFIAQLAHAGRQHVSMEHPTLWSASAVGHPLAGGTPHAMSRREIREIVGAFADAADRAKEAGCAGVEIQAAHGQLVHAFISKGSNRRGDEYGGSARNRLRFAGEVVQAIRERTGDGFIVGLRVAAVGSVPGIDEPADSLEAAVLLDRLELIDYFSPAPAVDAEEAGGDPDVLARYRSALRAPLVACGGVATPEQAEALVASGAADLVGLSRALIADPEWPLKAASGDVQAIRPCIRCMRCWVWVSEFKPLRCAVNPTVGQELAPARKPSRRSRVVVVGGGPAGLEAACASAEAGHDVTLFERGAALGGRLARPEGRRASAEASPVLDHLVERLRRTRVDVRLNAAASVDAVLALRADAVVVATGATPVVPVLPGDGTVPVVTYAEPGDGATVVVMDEDGFEWAAGTTMALARRGCRVVYVTRFLEPLREQADVTRMRSLRELDRLGVRLLPNMFVERCERGGVVLRHFYNTLREERIEGVEAVVWVGMQAAEDGLAGELERAGVAGVRVIGDAYAPRRLANAIQEGWQAAGEIGA